MRKWKIPLDARFNKDADEWFDIAERLFVPTSKEPILSDEFTTIYVDHRKPWGHVGILLGYDEEYFWVAGMNTRGVGVYSVEKYPRNKEDLLGFILYPNSVKTKTDSNNAG